MDYWMYNQIFTKRNGQSMSTNFLEFSKVRNWKKKGSGSRGRTRNSDGFEKLNYVFDMVQNKQEHRGMKRHENRAYMNISFDRLS